MTQPFQRLRRFLAELRRRNVYKVAATYAVVAFITLQAARLIFPATTLQGVYDVLVVVAFVGFPLVLVIAWAFEVTPEGVRRTEAPEGEEVAEPSRREKSRLAMKLLVGLGIVAGAVAGGWYLTGGGGESPEIAERTVAVLPFEVSGAGADTWRDGMVTMLSTGLDGAAGLRAIPDRTVFAAWKEDGKSGEGVSSEEALGLARQVGAEYAVVGSAVALGTELRLSAAVHETGSGERLGGVEVQGSANSIPSLADGLTRRVVGVLARESGEELPVADLASVTTRSLPALKAYLNGERHYRTGQFRAAAEDHRAAVEQDSTFALAYWRLSSALGWFEPRSDFRYRTQERAYELSHRLPRRERRLMRVYWLTLNQGQIVSAVDTLRRLTNVYPDDPVMWYLLGDLILHAGLPGGWPEADEALGRAVELDPGQAAYRIHRLQLAFSFHRDSALAAERAAAHPHPESLEPWFPLAMDLVFGTAEQRRQARARGDTIEDREANLVKLRFALQHPADGGRAETLLRDQPDGSSVSTPLVQNLLRRGQLEEALVALQESRPTDRVACGLSDALSLGFPVPDSVLRARLGPSALGEEASLERLLCAGVYLVERDEGRTLEELISRISEGAADTTSEGRWGEPRARDVIEILRGYRAWKNGELDRARRLLTRSVHPIWSLFYSWRGLWRGDLYRALGQLEDAEGWYLANWWHPVAHERLGQLYEEMGRPEKAVATYRRFIEAWKNADEELQPRVEAARKRLKELTASEAATND